MDEPVTTPLDVMCECEHRARFHEGRKRLCQMASCNCTGFVAKAEEVEAQSA